jgi:hypothetical protein
VVDNSGDLEYIALCSADTLLYVTIAQSQGLTATNTVNVPEWVIAIGDPT